MGRWSYSNRTEADNIKKIETSFLKKHGYFKSWRSGTITWTSGWDKSESSVGIEVSVFGDEKYLRIHYTQTDRDTQEKKDFDYKIPLTTTLCRYGGKRYWFTCPWYKNGAYCGRRVGVLYKDGNYFACRHCYDLTYSSQKQNRRSPFSSLFNVIDQQEKAKKIEMEIKHPYYRGKPTRKQRRVDRLYGRAVKNFRIYQQSEVGKKYT